METRKASLSSLKLCRFCLSQTEETLGNIYGRSRPPKSIVTLPLKIFSCLSFEVCPSDKMPVYICNRCKFFMELFYDFKHLCRQADENILQFIQNGTPLAPMSWPQTLLKFYRLTNKSEVAVMKTVIEGGATVQVTAHESESDDEDDENVYNVKIGDGSDEGSKSARVKVITSPEKTSKSKSKRGKDLEELDRTDTGEVLAVNNTKRLKKKNKRLIEEEDEEEHKKKNKHQVKEKNEKQNEGKIKKQPQKEYENQPVQEKRQESNIEKEKHSNKTQNHLAEAEAKKQLQMELKEECWACDQCHSTYPLQQMLELHRTLRHRQRTIPCHQCNAKFFTMSDMAVHQQTHVDELKFQCEACGQKFRRHIQLKRHEKIIHADFPQQACKFCPAAFLTATQLKSHLEKHANTSEKNHPCYICDKRFCEKSTLQRHIDNVHNAILRFACKYCSARFSTPTKLARHVRGNHAGDRSYPCKYCNKSFIKSHHYTRHLRLKHRENIRTCRGPFGETDQYRCEQCEDSFATQDQLIFHSAVHVRKNLICPLCAETFEDVETATAHIKSHANGAQHMCDFCELMFTTQEKLEAHMTAAHEDELRSQDIAQDDESSMEAEPEEEEDEDMNIKEEEDHMLVEIKKPNEFMLPQEEVDDKMEPTNSEDSEPEVTFNNDLTNLETLINAEKQSEKQPTSTSVSLPALQAAPAPVATLTKITRTPPQTEKAEAQTASILRKAEEIKKRVIQQSTESVADKKEKTTKPENSNTVGASDKSLRLLEKDLQELKRTTTRSEANKTPAKPVEMLRSRRAPIHTSTPKPRVVEEKKPAATPKAPVVEKKVPERRVLTKENKEPKENKDTKANNVSAKEDKKEEMPKQQNAVKNGNNDKSTPDEGVRRSTRPSKIRDYAKMVRDSPQESDNDSDDSDDDEEYKETEKSMTSKPKPQRSTAKVTPKPTPPATPAGTPVARKRGRPRKDVSAPKIRKEDNEEDEEESSQDTAEVEKEKDSKEEKDNKLDKDNKVEKEKVKPAEPAPKPMETDKEDNPPSETAGNTKENTKAEPEQKPASGVLVSPSGQTLKKIPIKALPPGVKPLPLPVHARPVAGGEVCEMQIGKKVVKVQKIVMTKAEVEAMAKKGLVEMKDGTMVLKQGIKLPTPESTLKTSLVSGEDTTKESLVKKEAKAAPSRCDLE